MNIAATSLLHQITRAAAGMERHIRLLSEESDPGARRQRAIFLHEEITRAEHALRAIREAHPIPDAP